MAKIHNWQTVTVQTINNNSSTLTYTTFDKEGTMQHFTIDGEVVKGETPQRIKRVAMPVNFKYKFKYDANDIDEKGSRERFFLLQHFSVRNPYPHLINPNLRTPSFILSDSFEDDIISYNKMKELAYAVDLLLSMSYEQHRDLVFFFNGDPTNMTHRQMFLFLAQVPSDKGEGVLYNDVLREKFLKFYQEQPVSAMLEVTVRKAIALSIIQGDGTSYKHNGTFVGADVAQVIRFYQANPDEYEQKIVPQVKSHEYRINPADLDTVINESNYKQFVVDTETVKEPVKEYTQEDIDKVQAEIEALQSDTSSAMKLADKTKLIYEKRQLIVKIQQAITRQESDKLKGSHTSYTVGQELKKGVKIKNNPKKETVETED